MSLVDRLVQAVRSSIERALPWYDPDEAEQRRRETERVRRRSIAARLRVEEVANAYKSADKVIRR